MTRDQMIEWLVRDDLDYISDSLGRGSTGIDWIKDILIHGFTGYAEQSDDVLRLEILERDEDAFNEETENA